LRTPLAPARLPSARAYYRAALWARVAVKFGCVVALFPASAFAASGLSERAAVHALRADLSRSYGIKRVHADCHRKSRVKFSCSWRGRRSDGAYRGRATVSRSSGRTSVSLTQVHKV
jgi:hypothetical protein